MIHRPEKILQVRVHDPLPTALNLLPDFAHGILCRSPSPISEVGFIEHRFEDRFQPIEQRLLAHPVINRRDSQRAKLARFPPSGLVPAAPAEADRHPLSVHSATDPAAGPVARRIHPDSARPHLHCPGWPSPPPRPSPGSSADTPCQLMNGPSLHPSG